MMNNDGNVSDDEGSLFKQFSRVSWIANLSTPLRPVYHRDARASGSRLLIYLLLVAVVIVAFALILSVRLLNPNVIVVNVFGVTIDTFNANLAAHPDFACQCQTQEIATTDLMTNLTKANYAKMFDQLLQQCLALPTTIPPANVSSFRASISAIAPQLTAVINENTWSLVQLLLPLLQQEACIGVALSGNALLSAVRPLAVTLLPRDRFVSGAVRQLGFWFDEYEAAFLRSARAAINLYVSMEQASVNANANANAAALTNSTFTNISYSSPILNSFLYTCVPGDSCTAYPSLSIAQTVCSSLPLCTGVTCSSSLLTSCQCRATTQPQTSPSGEVAFVKSVTVKQGTATPPPTTVSPSQTVLNNIQSLLQLPLALSASNTILQLYIGSTLQAPLTQIAAQLSNASYPAYFTLCQPQVCTYVQQQPAYQTLLDTLGGMSAVYTILLVFAQVLYSMKEERHWQPDVYRKGQQTPVASGRPGPSSAIELERKKGVGSPPTPITSSPVASHGHVNMDVDTAHSNGNIMVVDREPAQFVKPGESVSY